MDFYEVVWRGGLSQWQTNYLIFDADLDHDVDPEKILNGDFTVAS